MVSYARLVFLGRYGVLTLLLNLSSRNACA